MQPKIPGGDTKKRAVMSAHGIQPANKATKGMDKVAPVIPSFFTFFTACCLLPVENRPQAPFVLYMFPLTC